MKKNNAIALVGYIAVIMAPMFSLTGIVLAVVLICKGARIRQAIGLIIMGLITTVLGWNLVGDLPMYLTLSIFLSAIIYYFTIEE
jgi:Na+/phosphate symporter